MKIETARAIVGAARDAGYKIKLDESYSGRNMYGASTAAVVGSKNEIIKSIAMAAAGIDDDGSTLDAFVTDLNLRWDDMGQYYVVAY